MNALETTTLSRLNTLINGLHSMVSEDWKAANSDYDLRKEIVEECRTMVRAAFVEDNEITLRRIHEILAMIYDRDFSVPDLRRTDCETQPILRDVAAIFEEAMLDHEISHISPAHASDYPEEGREYVHWLKRLIGDHEASRHDLYRVHLVERGTREDIRFLLAQETSLDPRFDDILALIQVGTRDAEKMEIANNYWDEMGNGNFADVHTRLFADALDSLDIDDEYISRNLLIEARICGNLSAALAISRRHYYKAIGYFGVTEYLAPRRFRSLTTAWRRIGLPQQGIKYHDLHIGVDAGHAAGWYKNVVIPVINSNPRAGQDIAIGTMIRLNTSQRYLDAVQTHIDKYHTAR